MYIYQAIEDRQRHSASYLIVYHAVTTRNAKLCGSKVTWTNMVNVKSIESALVSSMAQWTYDTLLTAGG